MTITALELANTLFNRNVTTSIEMPTKRSKKTLSLPVNILARNKQIEYSKLHLDALKQYIETGKWPQKKAKRNGKAIMRDYPQKWFVEQDDDNVSVTMRYGSSYKAIEGLFGYDEQGNSNKSIVLLKSELLSFYQSMHTAIEEAKFDDLLVATRKSAAVKRKS